MSPSSTNKTFNTLYIGISRGWFAWIDGPYKEDLKVLAWGYEAGHVVFDLVEPDSFEKIHEFLKGRMSTSKPYACRLNKQYPNPHLKMYILVRKRAPIGVAAVNAAHVAVMAFDKFKHDKDMKKWFNPGPYYKVLVAVSDKEWKAAKRVRDHVLIREDMWGNREVAMAFKPRLNWPKAFKEFPFFPAKKTRKKNKKDRKASWTGDLTIREHYWASRGVRT